MKLIIAEKPSVGMAIANTTGSYKRFDGYMEGGGYAVSWCFGHLVEMCKPEEYDERYAKWRKEDLPIIPDAWKTKVSADKKAQFSILKSLMERDDVDGIIEATDAGREGELIFRLVYAQCGCRKPVERLWISSLETGAIREGLQNLKPGIEYDFLYEAALCRERADWLVGINATRLFSCLYGKTLRVGRVMTPTLAMVTEREDAIRNFVPEAFYTVRLCAGGIRAGSGRMKDKGEAEMLAASCMEAGTAAVKKAEQKERTEKPPALYDLTSLQRDANRLYGFTAKQTLDHIQSLYEKKLATYPRTDSRFLTEDMEGTVEPLVRMAQEKFGICPDTPAPVHAAQVVDGKKVTDHHAIIPTKMICDADLSELSKGEATVLAMVAERLICAVGEPYRYRETTVELSCDGHSFKAKGRTVTEPGWKGFASKDIDGTEETDGTEVQDIPQLREGQVLPVSSADIKDGKTMPPRRYTEDLLLSSMEKAGADDMGDDVERRGIGTPATRADIIEKLVKGGFMKREKKQLVPTENGMKLISVLPDAVRSPKLTSDWENALSLVARGELSMREFMGGIEEMVTGLVKDYGSMGDGRKNLFNGQAAETIGKCPKCGGDVVKGKYGAYCTKKCGMNVSRAMGVALSDKQVKSLLEGKKTLVKGLKGKNGSFDAYLIPDGIEDYSYTKDGKAIRGSQYKVRLEFQRGNKA